MNITYDDDDNDTVVHFPMRSFVWPPSPMELIGLIVITVMSFLANAGGLGGGGIMTPSMMIFFKLSIFECMPIANLFGMMAAGIRFVVNYRQKHPNPV